MIPTSNVRACILRISRFSIREQKYGFLWQKKKKKKRELKIICKACFCGRETGRGLVKLSGTPGKRLENK